MNQPMTPPPPPTTPPPSATPAKKGLPTLAWVAIGCGGLILVAALVVGGLLFWGARKAQEGLASFEDNPEMAAAEMLVRFNPQLELVEKDEEAGTLTIRDKKSGEVITADVDEISEGRLSFKTGDEETTVTFGPNEGDAGEGLRVTTSGDEGTSELKIGGVDVDDIPDWVPVYPGAEPTGTFLNRSPDTVTGAFSLSTTDSPDEILEYYAEVIEDLGLELDRTSFSQGGTEGGSVGGSSDDGSRELRVTAIGNAEGETAVSINFSHSP